MPQTNQNQITCPNCGHRFEATTALTSQIKIELENEYVQKAKTQEEKLKAEMNQKLDALEKQRQLELSEQKQKLETEIKSKVDLQLKDLQAQNEENQKKIQEANNREIELRKQARELEEARKNLELEIMRKIDEEKKTIVEQTRQQEAEKHRLEQAEKDKQLDQLKKSLEEANRKATQGSQQIQGDVQENDLKEILSSSFVLDKIEDVPTGVRGADLVHLVVSNFGRNCGKILWESKRTQRWSDDWVQKLKDDKANTQADVAIIATQVLPEGIKIYGEYKGIWVVQYNSAYILTLTSTIRHFLEEIYQVKNSQIGRDEKMEFLYKYLTGSQFRNKIENIVDAFSSMKNDLESEKRAMFKIWSKREKEISRVIDSTTTMYGDLEGIIGSKLEKIDKLELETDLEKVTDQELF
jgi:hypothetical protein